MSKRELDGKLTKGKIVNPVQTIGRFRVELDWNLRVIDVDKENVYVAYNDGETPVKAPKAHVRLWMNDPGILEQLKAGYPLLTEAIVKRIEKGEFYFFADEALKALEGEWQLELNIPRLAHKERGQGTVTYALHIDHPKQIERNAKDHGILVEEEHGYSLMEDYETGGDECIDTYGDAEDALSEIDGFEFDMD
jgi:hypothetical protein